MDSTSYNDAGVLCRRTAECSRMSRAAYREHIFFGNLSGLFLASAFVFFAMAGSQNSRAAEIYIADSAEPTDPAVSRPDSSPVMGGGVRNPPDIGAAGTGTVQDPIRSESPTEDPSIVPPITPPLSEQADPIEAPLPEKPLGQPEIFPDRKSEPDTLPDTKK